MAERSRERVVRGGNEDLVSAFEKCLERHARISQVHTKEAPPSGLHSLGTVLDRTAQCFGAGRGHTLRLPELGLPGRRRYRSVAEVHHFHLVSPTFPYARWPEMVDWLIPSQTRMRQALDAIGGPRIFEGT
jgi:hypothetical protein